MPLSTLSCLALSFSSVLLFLLSLWSRLVLSDSSLFPSKEVHIFWYAWYDAPPFASSYLHWTHSVLPHWTQGVTDLHRKAPYIAPGDPGVTYYPARGLYSSQDPLVMGRQLYEIKEAGIDVVVLSWWGQSNKSTSGDGQGVGTDHTTRVLLDAAALHGLKVAFHLEPYTNRTPLTVREDLIYIHNQYSDHSAYYKSNTNKGLFYIYDAHLNPSEDWTKVLTPSGNHTIRNTPYDCICIGLILDDLFFVKNSGFDGGYTYFAAEGFTQASKPSSWSLLAAHAYSYPAPNPSTTDTSTRGNFVFIPSLGPGYDDTRLRPWNTMNIRPRNKGQYYSQQWSQALALPNVNVISITSYNEWGEGTQIEPSIPFRCTDGTAMKTYEEDETPISAAGDMHDSNWTSKSRLYMELTKEWVTRWKSDQVHSDL